MGGVWGWLVRSNSIGVLTVCCGSVDLSLARSQHLTSRLSRHLLSHVTTLALSCPLSVSLFSETADHKPLLVDAGMVELLGQAARALGSDSESVRRCVSALANILDYGRLHGCECVCESECGAAGGGEC